MRPRQCGNRPRNTVPGIRPRNTTVFVVLCASGLGACAGETSPPPRRRALIYGGGIGFYAETFSTNEDPPRYLYPGQEELESMLTGDAESRRRYAALLPLLQASSDFGIMRPNDDYDIGILQTIAKEKWKEAMPLLAWGMQETAPGAPMLMRSFFRWRRRDQAGAVWLWLATQDMDDNGDLELILRILKDEEPSVQPGMIEPLADAIDRDTLRLIMDGVRRSALRDELIAFLGRADLSLRTRADLERAELVGRLLGKYGFALLRVPQIEEYLSRIAESSTLFAHIVVLRAISHLAHPGDAAGLDYGHGVRSDALAALSRGLSEKLWRVSLEDLALKERVRYEYALDSALGVEKMFSYLKELNETAEPTIERNLILQILEWLEVVHKQEPLPAEVIEYLRSMAADSRYSTSAMVMRPEEDILYHVEEVKRVYTFTRARAVIDRILQPRNDG